VARTIWTFVNSNLVATVVGGLSVIAIVAILTFVFRTVGHEGSGLQTSAELRPGAVHARKPNNGIEEIATRPVWLAPPKLISHALDGVDFEGDGYGPYVAKVAAVGDDNDVDAYSPRRLLVAGQSIAGLPIVVVGRVESDDPQLTDFGVSRVVRIIGAEQDVDAYIGTDSSGSFRVGDVVFALGRIAALGATSPLGGKGQFQSVYMLAMEQRGGDVEAVDDTTSDRAIARAAKGLAK
jgi:hypothetical protein